MVKRWLAKLKDALGAVRDFLDEKTFASVNSAPLSRLQKFLHFWLLVAKSFQKNRCPVHASALAYTTLLGLIPMLFVVISVSNSILKEEGGERISHFIDGFLVSLTPPNAPARAGTNLLETNLLETNEISAMTNTGGVNVETNFAAESLTLLDAAPAEGKAPTADREEIVTNINRFVSNIQHGKLGVVGVLALVTIAILMLSSIEGTFNAIWGVSKGRSWGARIVQYWGVMTLGPVLLTVALGLTHGAYLNSTRAVLRSLPLAERLLYDASPVAVWCLALTALYMMMPNARVHLGAAFAGGLVAGILWHVNNYLSIIYVSRWMTNSKIYGSFAVIPVFMAGLYISWLIILFGAQVAYAYQNRGAYLQEKQIENINQRGREFIALRLMQYIGQRFHRGQAAANVPDMAECLAVPSRLVHQILQTLIAARLVVEVAGSEPAYAPSRPLERLTCHDILLALRAGQGQELATKDEPARTEVYGEFEKIMRAEERAASSVTVLAMVNRTEEMVALAAGKVKAVTEGSAG